MHENIRKRLDEADKSEGYFVTITTLKDGLLRHYQMSKSFPKEDLIPSLEEIRRLVNGGTN